MEYGIWNMEYGIWNMEYGIWNIEYTKPSTQQYSLLHGFKDFKDINPCIKSFGAK
jgi:hypothetical protein